MKNIKFFNFKKHTKLLAYKEIAPYYLTNLAFYKNYPTINHAFIIFKYLRFFKKTLYFSNQFNVKLINNTQLFVNSYQKSFFLYSTFSFFFIHFFFGWATTFKFFFFFKNASFFNTQLLPFYDAEHSQEIFNYLIKERYLVFMPKSSIFFFNLILNTQIKFKFFKLNQQLLYKIFFFFLILNNSVPTKKISKNVCFTP